MFPSDLETEARDLLDVCRASRLKIATAESCTGGLIAALLTEIPGSSDVVDRGFVTYSNAAKMASLGVPVAELDAHGAVSEPIARAMAEGTLKHSLADVAIAVTGVAGPGGGSVEKPVGLVHIACARRGAATVHRACRFGDLGRGAVRLATVREAVALMRTVAAARG